MTWAYSGKYDIEAMSGIFGAMPEQQIFGQNRAPKVGKIVGFANRIRNVAGRGVCRTRKRQQPDPLVADRETINPGEGWSWNAPTKFHYAGATILAA